MLPLSLLILVAVVGSVWSLRVEDADEGPCPTTPPKPVPISDLSFLDRFEFVPAASRYNFYMVAASHPRFGQMRDFELVNRMCAKHNIPLSQPVSQGSVFGFGRTLGNYTGRHVGEQLGVTQFSRNPNPADPSGQSVSKLQTLTLTDYKTFAFFEKCWTTGDSQHKSWVVFSLTPQLTRSAKRMIENRAASLGFNRQDFVFLNYSNCEGEADHSFRGGWSIGGARGRRF